MEWDCLQILFWLCMCNGHCGLILLTRYVFLNSSMFLSIPNVLLLSFFMFVLIHKSWFQLYLCYQIV
jgi:hypothetical protein